MLDIKMIRQNPDDIKARLATRGVEAETIDTLLEKDKERRELLVRSESLKQKRNEVSEAIAQAKRNKEDATEAITAMREVGGQIKQLDAQLAEVEAIVHDMAACLPNLPNETIPVGPDEDYNVELRKVGTPRKFDFEPKAHWDICEEKNLVDFERGVKLSQSRFTLYRGKGARLERAIINFFLDQHTENEGYEEILPPFMANAATMTGTGQLPKFKEDMYKCVDEDLYLIPTAEVPVTNIYQDEILDEEMLPKYMTAYTPCFRREAGSAGKDTRGLIRQHQFNKVELVKLTKPEQSAEEHEKLTRDAENMLELLGLPYRRVCLSSGDIGFSAKKCYDLEVWMPSYNAYKEISSCSNFGDYQARRANIRYRNKETGKTEFVHTINGSGLAVGRTFAAIVENFQQPDGTIIIPEALRKYTGFDKI